MTSDIFYYDIAAVIVMATSLVSFILRCKTRTPANMVYFSALLLVTVMSLLSLSGELFDAYLGGAIGAASSNSPTAAFVIRSAITLFYYALRTLTAPAYLVLIATVSDTSHRLNDSKLTRILLWVPMIASCVFVLLNPLHHQVYYFDAGVQTRGPLIGVIYVSAVYYSLIGICWLVRWRKVLSNNEFATLMMLYPLVFIAVIIQFHYPHLRIEMFMTSIAMLLVSAFVLRPERQLDSLVNATSLHAYREMCRRAFITSRPLCLVYSEIVNMEQLRQLMGKDEMQDVIRGVATSLNNTLETGDILYYLRNGLFCIAPVNKDASQALAIAQHTHEEGKRRSLEKGVSAEQVRMRSCVVRVPQDIDNLDDLRTFVRRFSHLVPSSDATTLQAISERDDFALQMALPAIVERAIRERSFQIYYQPILCVNDGHFHSAEALVRLHDPEFGWVSPSLFIPVAEQSGAILDIGSILLQKICEFLGSIDYDALELSYVEVNLSVEQCIRPQLADELMQLAQSYGISPSRLNLEITETSSNFSQEIVEANVRKLANAGFTFSIDDYGTGYSNVTRMLRLPFSLVKFDKSFVDNLEDPASRTVLEDSISMVKKIGKDVLIEGVETAAQARALRAMGADYIQGYLYAKPLPQDEFVAFLAQGQSTV